MLRMRRIHQHILILITLALFLFGLTAYVTLRQGHGPPATKEEPFPGTGGWARTVLGQMTLEEKVSQLFLASTTAEFMNVDSPDFQELADLVERFQAGGFVLFQSEPLAQVVLINDLQRRSRLPLLIGQDMEWGAGMRVEHATTFPRTMAIGASRNTNLAYGVGLVTAREARALGVHQVYAPVSDVNNNPSNPVINVRSYGEDPDLVAAMVTAHVHGLQDGGIIATAKHFPGHGDTAVDSHLDLPVLPFSRSRLDRVELVPFQAAIDRGVMSIMTGHLSLPELEPDARVPATLSAELSTRILRNELGFRGLIVTDAMNMHGVTRHFGPGEAAVRAVEAGADLILMSTDVYAARRAILNAIDEGRLSEDRIDRSVLQMLRAKEWLGLDQNRLVEPEGARVTVQTREHVMLTEVVARAGLTLLSNAHELVPFSDTLTSVAVVIVSDGTDPATGEAFVRHLRSFLPGTPITTRLLDRRSHSDHRASALEAAAEHDVVIIPAYVQARSGSGRLSLSPDEAAVVNEAIALPSRSLVISFGNPYLSMEMDAPDAFLVAYSASGASQKAAAQAITGRAPITGSLPVTIPAQYPFGHGLQTTQAMVRTGYPEEVGMDSDRVLRVDSLILSAIDSRYFPAAAVAVGRAGVSVHQRGYGHHTYDSDTPVSTQSVFDVASLTKVIATTTAVMKLYDAGRLDLNAHVADYIPAFGVEGKELVTVHQVLTHSAGLRAFIPFHTMGFTTREQVLNAIFDEELTYTPGTQFVYSDLGFILLGLIIERITGEDLAAYVHREVFEPLGMRNTRFRSLGLGSDPSIVPTEIDRDFRRRLVHGEVHDETAYLLGGVAGHAGLFSTVEDLTKFAYMLLSGGRINGRQFIRAETVALFSAVADPTSESTRALGWDTRAPEGYSSAGKLFGPRSFGHTGFTGTSLWIDPDQRLFVILLTNRVYPTRESPGIFAVRAELADIAYGSIVGLPEPLIPRDPRTL